MEDFKLDSSYILDKNGFTMSYPTGSIVGIFSSTVPTGWILCDGQSYSQSDYPNLAEVFGVTSGTFNVPDLHRKMLSSLLSTGNTTSTFHGHTPNVPTITIGSTTINAHTHNSGATHSSDNHASHYHNSNMTTNHSLGFNNSNVSNRATGNTTFIAGTTHNHNYAEYNASSGNASGMGLHTHGNKAVPVNASYAHNHANVTQSLNISNADSVFPESLLIYYIIKS
jgi:microcystin-dependent protein